MLWANFIGSVRAALFIFTTLTWETGNFLKVWHSNAGDKGGATMWGIASASAPPEIARAILARSLTLGDALVDIYLRYYEPLNKASGGIFERLDYRLAFLIFDARFHGSQHQTVLFLQKELSRRGAVLELDGKFGVKTASALLACSSSDCEAILHRYSQESSSLGKELALNTIKSAGKAGDWSADWTSNFVARNQWKVKAALAMPVPA